MNHIKRMVIIMLMSVVGSAYAGDYYQTGKVYDITSTTDGLLVRLEGNIVPTQCPHGGWMLIPEENKTMISLALASFMQGKTKATIYTQGTVGGYCKVTQYDDHP
jgi:hypothetical protein